MEMAYVQALVSALTDAEALRESGVARSTFYDWPKERREHLRSLALERRWDIAVRALGACFAALQMVGGELEYAVPRR